MMLQQIDWIQVVVSFSLGMCTGQIVRFERFFRGKRAFLRLRMEWPSPESRWVNLLLVVLFLVSTAQVTWWTFRQRQCNEAFQNTTIELRRIADEDRDLARQDDELRNQRDDALTAMISGLINSSPDARPDTRALLNQLNDTNAAIDVKRDDLYARRADLERQRQVHKLPSSRC